MNEDGDECFANIDNIIVDSSLEYLWDGFADVPIDENEMIEEDFLKWSAGTFRELIWHWFDDKHSKGVEYLIYGK